MTPAKSSRFRLITCVLFLLAGCAWASANEPEPVAITQLSPGRGPIDGAIEVSISGANFHPDASVYFGSFAASNVVVESENALRCIPPPHFPTVVDVRVINPDGAEGILLHAFVYESDPVHVRVPVLSGLQAAFVEAPLEMMNANGIVAIDGEMTFDSTVLRPIAVRTGDLTTSWSVVTNTTTPGAIRFSLASSGAPIAGDGSALRFEFEIVGSAEASTPLRVNAIRLNDGVVEASVANGLLSVDSTHSLSGTVRFWSSYQPVSGVELALSGNGISTPTTTDSRGAFEFGELPDAEYALLPKKSDEVFGITAYDASLILRHSAGIRTLSGHAAIAADVNRSGEVTAMDAFLVLQKSVGLLELPFPGAGKTWFFSPDNRVYSDLPASRPSENFIGILLGNVSGEWQESSLFAVADFGARGDGTTDDTGAIQAANDAAAAVGGGCVLFEAGKTYICRGFNLDSYVHLDLNGATLKHPDGRLSGSVIEGRTRSTLGTIAAGSRELVVSNVSIFEEGSVVAIRGAQGPSTVNQFTETTADLGPLDAAIPIASSFGFPVSPLQTTYAMLGGQEIISYEGISGGVLQNVSRGLFGTTATEHAAGTLMTMAMRLYTEVESIVGNVLFLKDPAAMTVKEANVTTGILGAKITTRDGFVDGSRVIGGTASQPFPVRLRLARWCTIEGNIRNGDIGGVMLDRGTRDCRVRVNVLDTGQPTKGGGAGVWVYAAGLRNRIDATVTGDSNHGIMFDERTNLATEWDAECFDNVVERIIYDCPRGSANTNAGVAIIGCSRNTIESGIIRGGRFGVLIDEQQGTAPYASTDNLARNLTLIDIDRGIYFVSGGNAAWDIGCLDVNILAQRFVGVENEFVNVRTIDESEVEWPDSFISPYEMGGVTLLLHSMKIPHTDESVLRVLVDSGAAVVNSLEFDLTYNAEATLEDIRPGGSANGLSYAWNSGEKGRLRVAFAGAEPVSGLRDLLTLQFRGSDPLGALLEDYRVDDGGVPVVLSDDSSVFDSDGDGLIDPDEIEIFGTDPNRPDTTGDGISDSLAVRLGLDPADPSSRFSVSMHLEQEDLISLSWPAYPGNLYEVQYHDDVAQTWLRYGELVLADSSSATLAIPLGAASSGLFRVKFGDLEEPAAASEEF